jgi:hypothetical protein
LSYLEAHVGSEPTERDSLSRFVTATQLSKAQSIQTLGEAVYALKRVEIKGYTQWQIGYELQTQRVAFQTTKRPKLREVSLIALQKKASRERDPCKRVLTYDLSGDQVGDVSEMFSPPVHSRERSSMRRRLKRLKLSQRLADALTAHGARCIRSDKPETDH